ncbi:MAG TPA: hypothetical protein VFE33_09325 [Thermoanaerobaculia bacterium]|nr:hypothetical protein [Thermoanaerobaculia bacterium]
MTIYDSDQPRAKRFAPRSLTLVALGVAGLMLSNGVLAQEAPIAEEDSLVYVVAKSHAEIKRVKEEVGQATTTINTLADSLTQAVQKRVDIDHQTRQFDNSAENQRLDKDRDDFSASCAGRRVYGSDVARCQNALTSIDQRTGVFNERVTELHAQYYAQVALIQRLVNDQVLANARITKLKNYLSWLAAADGKLSMALAKSCDNMPSNATIEELKHSCGNIQFDAAYVDLPTCEAETERCKAWIIYAKPQRTPEQAIQDYRDSGGPTFKAPPPAAPPPPPDGDLEPRR